MKGIKNPRYQVTMQVPRRTRGDGESWGDADSVYDLKRREIYIFGEVDETTAFYTLRALRILDTKEGPITVMMSSCGGSDYDGWAIYDALRMANNEITVEGYGQVLSIAALILQGGSNRFLAPRCRFMIHNGSVDLGDVTYEGLKDNTKEMEHLSKAYHEALAERSSLDIRKIRKLCERDTYMPAEEAVEHGFADAILHKARR